ncbi:MAG TPA: hypothetical protein VHB25_15810 [Gemmatimonadaceae bacterium]|nr:hypothetical protein [Gemmatimonadaceae bacterium]
MTDRHKPHNGRDTDGRFRVRQEDVEDVLEDPIGPEIVRDDVRLGGAVADTGPHAGDSGRHIGDLIQENSVDVGRTTGRLRDDDRARRKRR